MTLELSDVSVAISGKTVVQNVGFNARAGEIVAVLGANGAGKSELVLGIAGMLPLSSGRIKIDGKDITGNAPDAIRAAGVAAVPEGHRVLSALSVDENLRAAGAVRPDEIEVNLEATYGRFPELAERKTQKAGTLSGGQQQMVAVGHALMSRPQFLIVDEMSLGLAPLVVKRLIGVIETLKAEGVGVILIEQFVDLALAVADTAVVLRQGEVSYAGEAVALANDKSLLDKAYFGVERAAV